MRRQAALLRLEARLEYRYGIHATAAVLAVAWTALLLAIPPPAAVAVAPLVLLLDTATFGVSLLAAQVLFERSEGAQAALFVAPVRLADYVAVKVIALTAVSLGAAVPVAIAAARGVPRLASVLTGVGLTAVLMLLISLAQVARHRTLTAFLSVAPWPLIPLLGIPLLRGIGLLDHPAALIVPTVGTVDLIAAGFDATADPPRWVVAYLLAWIAATAWLAAARLRAAWQA